MRTRVAFRMARLGFLALLFSALGGFGLGCGDDARPVTLLDNLRVLALGASPLEAGPGEEVQVFPFLYLPPEEALVQSQFTFCPFSAGSVTGFACALPACEMQMDAEANGGVRLRPYDMLAACAAQLGGMPGTVDPGSAQVPESIETVIRYQATSTAGLVREAVLRLPVYLTDLPSQRNQPPKITRVTFDGEEPVTGVVSFSVAAEQEVLLRVEIDPASMDQAAGEVAIVSFFSTTGRFDFSKDEGLDISMPWTATELSGQESQAEIYVVARDLRGGQTLVGPFVIPLVP